ncbi:metalloregulator ArsR/SmtB family transcription factor [Geotalea sp. SG265]|uniref:ArsR/SmtB family transcription factor n=1 Tax=Geotalea sp. SG265 TaxID=2922867 RepID=UPI001FAF7A62|nr:metalloregulator ArsR/SmtB family transcription factor [Geotalea sp. SG265]
MTVEEKALLLRILGHPVRLRIVTGLADRCVCVKEMWQHLCLPQAVVSQHLKILKDCGIVTARREGTRVCYSVQTELMAELVSLLSPQRGPAPCAADPSARQ